MLRKEPKHLQTKIRQDGKVIDLYTRKIKYIFLDSSRKSFPRVRKTERAFDDAFFFDLIFVHCCTILI